ncbi:uncharacterized protein LOC106051934 isoform X3 [Biomphalaria glabrata]|uniref:Uncharacterized protein LOC106051934 isoform X3 n=1 Tax=Biomphalaria glabrata TaxID=6526 RepID=A0A9W3A0J9_BIOGL|nr:uncharacterized protein LOC106051934 isoform X3 [Biomphalaria glabrata]
MTTHELSHCPGDPGYVKAFSLVAGTEWDRKVKLYYWTLANVNEFLYQGKIPEFIEKGPYVYIEQEVKEDVAFAVTEVTYRLNRKYTFDLESTISECRVCQTDEQLSIINTWYLQMVGLAGGENSLAWSYVPKYTSEFLRHFGFIYTDEDVIIYNSNVSILGSISSATPPEFQPPWSHFFFGSWLNGSSSSSKSTLLSERKDQSFTILEITALYKVFSNVTLLGGQALALPNVTLQAICDHWAENICSSYYVKLKGVGVPECGIYYVLKRCQDMNITSQAREILQKAFCPPGEDGCLNFTGAPDDLLPAYRSVIFDFLLFLSEVVLESVKSSRDMSPVVTRNQSELALGYNITVDSVIGVLRVPGVLQMKWKDGTRPLWNVLTCLDDRDMNNNMVLQRYNNMWSTPAQLLRNPNLTPSLTSFTDFATSCSALRACATCYSLPASITIFMEDLLRPVPFDLNSSSSLSDVDVYNYTLNKDVLFTSDLYLVDQGLQAMSGITGYTSWAGLPHAVGGSIAHLKMEKSQKPGDTFVVVEPVTGRVWEKHTQLQWNAAVSNESAFFNGRKVSAVHLPLPVYWWHRSAVISSSQVDYYKHLVSRLMPVACGGLVGFSVVAVLVAILGAIICVYPSKPNRVVPMMEDSATNLPNGKHF